MPVYEIDESRILPSGVPIRIYAAVNMEIMAGGEYVIPPPSDYPGKVLWIRPGQGVNSRGAVQLNGVDQTLSVSSPTLTPGADNFWMAGFFRVDADKVDALGSQGLMTRDDWGTQRGYGLAYAKSVERFRFVVSPDGSSIVFVDTNSSGNVLLDQWVFLFAYRSGSQIGVSTDNNSFNTNTFTGSVFPSTEPFQTGTGQTVKWFGGKADQLAWGRSPSMTMADIRTLLYNGGNGLGYSALNASQKAAMGLVSFWELGELSGNRLDSHGSNHLTPSGTTPPTATDGVVQVVSKNLDPVYTHYSAIGAARFSEATLANRPIYRDGPYIDYLETNARLTSTEPVLSSLGNYTLFIKSRPTSLGADRVLYCEQDATNTGIRVALNAGGNAVVNVMGLTLTSSGAVSAGVDSVLAIRKAGSVVSVFVNGVLSAAGTITSPPTLTGTTARIGGPILAGNFFRGRILDIFGVNSPIQDEHVASLSGAL